jgi:ATP-independent RNA helicase DbpA
MMSETQTQASTSDFTTLPIGASILEAVVTLGFASMTPVQEFSLPWILAGEDVIAQAKTGSGKTVAFAIGVLEKIDTSCSDIQAIVMCPTRELADQVCKEIRKVGRCLKNLKVISLCGGSGLGPQLASLSHGGHIVVGTPGRIEDHLSRRTLSLAKVKVLVLDEADRMLDMGFSEAISGIVAKTPKARQTLLFSATFSEQVRGLSGDYQRSPKTVTVDSSKDKSEISQNFYWVKKTEKTSTLIGILKEFSGGSSIVFCDTKLQCHALADELNRSGMASLAIHGDLEQKDRNQVLVRFSNRSCGILIATDVAARGLDIKEVALVVNLYVPRDPEVYVHRIGRTGRAGKHGVAITLVTDIDQRKLGQIGEYLNTTITPVNYDWSKVRSAPLVEPEMITLCINGGRKNKLRPGDILGGLTGPGELAAADIGKIDILDYYAYVAVRRGLHKGVLAKMAAGAIKGKNFRFMVVD